MKVISLFSGAGGLDLGARASGATVVGSVEADADCCATLRANGFDSVFEGRIEKFSPHALRKQLGIAREELDILFGGPPCQPFSKSALWTNVAAQGLQDPRASTLDDFIDYVAEFRPRAVLLENVEGFQSGGGLDYVLAGLKRLRAGFQFSWSILDASQFGVPQRRRRLFLVALRGRRPFKFPAPTHCIEQQVTAWDAISPELPTYDEDLSIRGRWAELIATIPEGKNYLWHTDRGGGEPLFGWRTRYWSFLYKLAKDAPAPTIVASPSQNTGPYHWDNRLLSTSELAALQSFPAEHRFAGLRPSRQRQIGNAVPPLLARVLFSEIASQLNLSVGDTIDLGIARKGPAPAPNPLEPVPERFLDLRGTHRAHPGTGKGPRPRRPEAEQAASGSAAVRGKDSRVAA